MTYLASVAYHDSTVVLKMTAGVDKHIFAYGDVFTEIRIEGWENAQRLRYFITEQLGKQFAHFVWRMISRIQAERDATGLVAHLVHKTVNFLRIKRLPCLYVCLEIFYRHIYCLSNFTVISPPIFRASMPSPSIRPILIKSLLCDQFLQKIATLPHGA